MQKIITALDGMALSQSSIDYTVFIATNCKAHVVGIFLDDFLYQIYGVSESAIVEGTAFDDRSWEPNRETQAVRDQAVQVFEQACQNAGLEYSIHRDHKVALQELLHESIYADLLIIDSKETFTRFEQKPPTEFLRNLLSDVQCPVLVVPQSYIPPEELVLLYDGKPPSVHAVKMCSYLFPSLKYMATEVLSIKDGDETAHLPDNRLMKEFMKRHFPNASYTVLKGDPEDEIIGYLRRFGDHKLVVLGAYGRSQVSRWFRSSMADELLKNLKLPLFIAPKK